MEVEVRPIQKKKWHGKTGKDSFTRTKKIQALVDGDTYKYKTGLTDKDIKFLGEKGFKGDLSDEFDPNMPHSLWDSKIAVVELKNSTQIFKSDQPLDRLKICIMRANEKVANSLKEYEDGDWPEATHVLFDEKDEIEAVASKIAIKNKAVVKSMEISKERKAQIILILAGKLVKDKSTNHVDVEMNKLIEKDPATVLRAMTKDSEDTVVEALILEALTVQKLTKRGHKFYYFDSFLGGSMEEVVDYLKEDENQELRFKLESSL